MRLCLPNLSQNHTRTTKKCSKATRYLQIVAHFSTMNFWEFEYPFFLHNILIIRSSNCVKSVDKSMFCSVWKGIFRYIVNRWSISGVWFFDVASRHIKQKMLPRSRAVLPVSCVIFDTKPVNIYIYYPNLDTKAFLYHDYLNFFLLVIRFEIIIHGYKVVIVGHKCTHFYLACLWIPTVL